MMHGPIYTRFRKVVSCERTDRQTDVIKLIVAFRNFVNAPKNMKRSNQSSYPTFKFLYKNNYHYLLWVLDAYDQNSYICCILTMLIIFSWSERPLLARTPSFSRFHNHTPLYKPHIP